MAKAKGSSGVTKITFGKEKKENHKSLSISTIDLKRTIVVKDDY